MVRRWPSFAIRNLRMKVSFRHGKPHLVLREIVLAKSEDCDFDFTGWCFLGIAHGSGVCLCSGRSKLIEKDEVLVFHSECRVLIQASHLCGLTVQVFCLCPEILGSFLTTGEMHYIVTGAPQKCGFRVFPPRHPVAQSFRLIKEEGPCALPTPLFLLRCRMMGVVAEVFGVETEQSLRLAESDESTT